MQTDRLIKMDVPLEYEEIASIGIGMFKRLNGNSRHPALLAMSEAVGGCQSNHRLVARADFDEAW